MGCCQSMFGTTYQPLWKVEEIARPGDLISFNREDGSNNTNDGSQVVLYIGDGRVATICTENLSLSHNNNAPVREMALDVVAKGRQARIDNFREIGEIVLNLKPRSPEAMIQEAKRCWNREVPYEARFRNSEYYCTFWKYGFGFSKQIMSNGPVGWKRYERFAEHMKVCRRDPLSGICPCDIDTLQISLQLDLDDAGSAVESV